MSAAKHIAHEISAEAVFYLDLTDNSVSGKDLRTKKVHDLS
jgi:hypothetical protein